MSISEIDKRKVKWRCRLGILELDILFNDFVDANLENLLAPEVYSLLALLKEDNDKLESWLISKSEAVPGRYKTIISIILEDN